jgi:competence protein ComEC
MSESTLPATVAGRLAARLADERERWVLWLPVGVGVGIGLYFALPAEPSLWPAGAVLAFILAGLPSSRGASGPAAPADRSRRRGGGLRRREVRTLQVDAP